jgi:hypothetical protein
MTLTSANISWRYSGGSANDDPELSLGGEISSEVIPNAQLGNLFPEVFLPESFSGSEKYRCIYLINTSGIDTLETAYVHISSQTPAASTSVQIGLDPAGIGNGVSPGAAQEIVDEFTPPDGVAFADYPTSGSGLTIGDLGPGEAIAIWVKRTIDPGSSTPLSDPFRIRVEGIPS